MNWEDARRKMGERRQAEKKLPLSPFFAFLWKCLSLSPYPQIRAFEASELIKGFKTIPSLETQDSTYVWYYF